MSFSEWSEPEKQYSGSSINNDTSHFSNRTSRSSETIIKNVENIALATATAKQKPSLWTKSMFMLYLCLAVPTLLSCTNGYIGNVMNSVNSYEQYRRYFGFDLEKGTPANGIVYAIYPIGTMVGCFAVGPAADNRGRKWGMTSGCLIILIFTAIQATSASLAQFMIARFMLGVGVAISLFSGIVYVSEMAHPSYRGLQTGFFNIFWYIGGVPGTFIPYATSEVVGSNAWRIPLWGQAFFPVLVLCLAPFLPESPRWLIANSRHAEALSVMAQYHGEGDRFSPIVQLEYKEMVEEISTTSADKRWWDYKSLFGTHENRYRSMLAAAIGLIGQWTGSGPVSYYYGTILENIGVTDVSTQKLLGGLQIVVSFIAAACGAFFTDRIGRRKQLMISTFIIILIFICIAPLSATNLKPDAEGKLQVVNEAQAKAQIVLFFIFGVVFSAGYTPLQLLYPVECLRFENRAKGMGLYGLFVNAAGFYTTMVTEIAFTNIGWKYYFLFIFWNIAALIFIYFFFVETRNRTLEELTEIFKSKYPVKTSKARGQVVIKGQDIITHHVDRVVD